MFKPHKDRCNICVGKDIGNVSDEDYKKHYEMKCGALEQKEVDKNNGNGNSVMYCWDIEALLVSPRNKSNAMYYRTKLNIHNLTFYDLKIHEVLNYLWNEVDGQIECDNFISIHVDYLRHQIVSHSTISGVIGVSNYQNRCKELSNALLFLAVHFKVTLLHKYQWGLVTLTWSVTVFIRK